jgi:hypothetical protein
MYAFDSCDGISDIFIPEVKRIEQCAFSCCENLGVAKVVKGMTALGRSAFFADRKLVQVEIPAGCRIRDWAFRYCESLGSVLVGGVATRVDTK